MPGLSSNRSHVRFDRTFVTHSCCAMAAHNTMILWSPASAPRKRLPGWVSVDQGLELVASSSRIFRRPVWLAYAVVAAVAVAGIGLGVAWWLGVVFLGVFGLLPVLAWLNTRPRRKR